MASFDQGIVLDDFLGDTETDADGRFEIRFLENDFKDMIEVRNDVGEDEYFEIRVPRAFDSR